MMTMRHRQQPRKHRRYDGRRCNNSGTGDHGRPGHRGSRHHRGWHGSSRAPRLPPPANGELEGMKGTTPKGADVSAWIPAVNDFWVAKGNPELTDFNYAAEAYDAVIVIALAVQAAQDDGSAHAAEIDGITKDGEKCTTYADCLAIIDAGGDPDYDGISGPLDFNGNGEPLQGFVRDPDVRRRQPARPPDETLMTAESPESSIVDARPGDAERAGDGVLKIGIAAAGDGKPCVPRTTRVRGCRVCDRRDQQRRWRARQAGRVHARVTRATPRPTRPTVTSTRLLGEGVDAIIGAASLERDADRCRQDHGCRRHAVQPGQHQPGVDDLRRQGPLLP